MKLKGTFETDLIFTKALLHIGQKDGEDFSQVSFINLGLMHSETKSTKLTENSADVVIPVNDFTCRVYIEKNDNEFCAKTDFEALSFENKPIEVKKLSDEVEFSAEYYSIPQNNREILIKSSEFESDESDLNEFDSNSSDLKPFDSKPSEIKLEYDLENREVLEFLKSEGITAPTDRSFSSALKLMAQTSKLYHHDGIHSMHDRKNRGTIAQIKFAKNQNNYTNCRGMAIIFAGVLRAFGYKAAYVECCPEKSDTSDIHVVCEVYIDELDKFVMLDPSNNLVFYLNDLPLSLIELRRALCEFKEDEISLNTDANHNGEKIDKIAQLAYMSKNLVYLQKCIVNNESLEMNEKNSICLTSRDLLDDNSLEAGVFTSNISEFYSKK